MNVGEHAGARVEADENLAGVEVSVAMRWELARRGAVECVADEARIASLLHQLRGRRRGRAGSMVRTSLSGRGGVECRL